LIYKNVKTTNLSALRHYLKLGNYKTSYLTKQVQSHCTVINIIDMRHQIIKTKQLPTEILRQKPFLVLSEVSRVKNHKIDLKKAYQLVGF